MNKDLKCKECFNNANTFFKGGIYCNECLIELIKYIKETPLSRMYIEGQEIFKKHYLDIKKRMEKKWKN